MSPEQGEAPHARLWYAFPRLAKIPPSEYQAVVLEAAPATLLDYGTMKPRKVSKVSVVQTLRGNVAASEEVEKATGRFSIDVDWLEEYSSGVPGWVFHRDADRAFFDGQWRAAVDGFSERLGEPETVVRHDTGGSPWNHAAWRRGGNAVVVGQRVDNGSYMTFEQALIWVGPHAADEPFPTAEEFSLRLECRRGASVRLVNFRP